MIVLDLETNSNNPKDVLEIAALKIEKQGNQYVVVDTFHRYYYSRYPTNSWALDVHNLSPGRIRELRDGASYPEHFEEDSDFEFFCRGSKTLISHNVTFELRYLDSMVLFENHFCTMKTNKSIVGVLNKNGNLKNPKLIETCNHYNIRFSESNYHSAIYDANKALEILNKMNSPQNGYDIVSAIIEEDRTIKEAKERRKLSREENKTKREQNKGKRVSQRKQWDGLVCPQCASANFALKGKRQRKHYSVQRFQCNKCNSVFSEKINSDGTPTDFVSKNTESTSSISELPRTKADEPRFEWVKPVMKDISSNSFDTMEVRIHNEPFNHDVLNIVRGLSGRRFHDSSRPYWTIPFRSDYENYLERKFAGIALLSFEKYRKHIEVIASKPKTEGCYIATSVYGNYDAPEVLVLRRYRDRILRNHPTGRLLISFYYFASPSIVKVFKGRTRINSVIKQILDALVEELNRKQFCK